jgi:uncharacterized protein (DUF2062 family)
MIHFTRRTVAKWLGGLLHVHDSPRRTATAYALGVFFGFSPFLGLHTILGLGFAFALNLNRVAVLLGVYSNLPWIIGPYYAFATAAGGLLLGQPLPPDFATDLRAMFEHSVFDDAFWRSTVVFKPLFRPFMVGSLAGAALLAGLAYRAALTFVLARREAERTEAPGPIEQEEG